MKKNRTFYIKEIERFISRIKESLNSDSPPSLYDIPLLLNSVPDLEKLIENLRNNNYIQVTSQCNELLEKYKPLAGYGLLSLLSLIKEKNINQNKFGDFSPNLTRFLEKNPHYSNIYVDPITRIWYIGTKDGNIWCGTKLVQALCHGKEAPTYSLGTGTTNRFIDRTEQFQKCSNYFGRRMFPKWY